MSKKKMKRKGLAEFFRRMARNIQSWISGKNKNLQDVAKEFSASVERGFDRSRSPSGEPWSPVKRKGRPLILTGRLRRNAIAASGVIAWDGQAIYVRLKDPFYGVFHQRGTSRILKREFFGLDAEGEEAVAEVIADSALKFIVQ